MPFLFMPTVLQYIAHPRFFRRIFALFLRIVAVLCLIGILYVGAAILSSVGSNRGAATLGGIVFFICLLIGAYMVVHTILLRAANILHLPDSDLTVMPLICIFLRLFGEVMACFYVTLGAGAGLMFLFAGTSVPVNLLYSLRSNIPLVDKIPFLESGGFLGGATFILSGALIGFSLLTLCYLLSEALSACVESALHLRAIRQTIASVPAVPTGSYGASGSAPTPAGPMTQVVPAPQAAHCYQCGNTLQPGSAFCERCGARVN